MPFGVGGSGGYGSSSERSSQNWSANYWTPEQKKAAGDLWSNYFSTRIGTGLPGYGGQLPGTSGPSDIQKTLFGDAEAGTGAFASWARLAGPEEWHKRVSERAATEQGLLQPAREKEDALLKSRMAGLGLSSSSDVVKAEMDLSNQRELQDQQFRQGMYDYYENLGLQVTPQVIETMSQLGESQRQITEQGLQSKFQEWLRTQPEYSPVIEQLLGYLGLRGEESGQSSSRGSSTSWGIGADVSWVPGT
jgi:hypothetical protein